MGKGIFMKTNLRNIIVFFLVIFFTIVITLFMLFPLRGAEDPTNVDKYVFYAIMLILCFIAIALDQLTDGRKVLKWFDTYLHNPNKGFLPKNTITSSPLLLLLLSIIIFSLISIVGVATNTFFIAHIQQQIVPLANVYLGGEPASGGETLLFFAVMLGIGYGIATKIAKKNMILKYFLLILFALIIGFGLYPTYHYFVYGADESALFGTMSFGGANAIITTATGSIIPAWTWHSLTNFLDASKEQFGKESTIIFAVSMWLMFVALFISLYLRAIRNPKKYRNLR